MKKKIMKLQYKIVLIIIFFAIFILISISVIYSRFNLNEVIQTEHKILTDNAIETAHHIEIELKSKLSITKTLSSSPIVIDTLLKSNDNYQKLSNSDQKSKIAKLNAKWKKAKSADDEFIKLYLNNPLSKYLKKQQSVLPGVYGEIFITNRYGAMIATTGKLSTLAHAHKYWWIEAYNDGKGRVFFDDRGFDDSVQGYVIGIVIPIKKDGEIIGIIKSNVNIMGTLNHVVKSYSLKNRGVLKIVRTKGLIVLEDALTPLSTTLTPKLLQNLIDMDTGSRIITDQNKETFVAYSPIRLTIDNPNISFGGKKGTGEHLKGNNAEVWHTVIKYDSKKALSSTTKANRKITFAALFFLIISILLATFVGRWISRTELKRETKRRKEAEQEVEKKTKELSKSNEALEGLNETLEQRVVSEIDKNSQKDEIMLAQSRQAAMGDMISMIAHQWRQPITAIGMGAQNMQLDIELGEIDSQRFDTKLTHIVEQTEFLSKTIDDFRDFLKPNRKPKVCKLSGIVENTLAIVGKSLENNNIRVEKSFEKDTEINTYSSEIIQVLLNIINNAKDIINIKEVNDGVIKISIDHDEENVYFKICDNAGGIPDDVLPRIFEPYYTTKEEKGGTGLGLYMSKMIVAKHLNGAITTENIDGGACFTVSIPLK